MNSYDFKDRVVVVTGGAGGFGKAIAARLLESGAQVELWDINAEALEAANQELAGGARVGVCAIDLTDNGAVHAAVKEVMTRRGRIDGLVHSAGITGPTMPLADYPVADWERVIQTNLVSTFHVNQAVVKVMIAAGYGRIVNVASIAAKEGNPNASAYGAAKAGVLALTKSLGKETATLDIAVNAITPAAARTKLFDQMPQSQIDYMLAKIPRGRFVEVDEVVSMTCWLLSQENSCATGAVFDLSAGRATY
ncbi:MAG TPA: SDR family NAD(P)-dependent oxidoreductase [Roseateles sp.]|uniref:SDR family NAD(P)-dependent oxidoreductase n=1 Tax=Roseateles sp. TaxID=1971397 RepID=UPI002EDB4ACD